MDETQVEEPMDSELQPVIDCLKQKRRRAGIESLLVLVAGLALMMTPAEGVTPLWVHVGRALGLALALAGFFWHRKVLRWPEAEEAPVVQVLRESPEQVARVLTADGDGPGTAGDEGPPPARDAVVLVLQDGERLQLPVPPDRRSAVLATIARRVPHAFRKAGAEAGSGPHSGETEPSG